MSTETEVVETGYRSRPHQQQIHRSLKRFNVLVCHRRFGKTVLCINELIHHSVYPKREASRFAYVAPTYKQAKRVAWDYIKEYTRGLPGTKWNESELRVDLANDSRIQLLGAEDYDSLRGMYLDGVVLDEYAQMPPKAWSEVIRPALADREGWAIFIGTPKGRNSFWELYEYAGGDDQWFAAMFRASETGILPQAELEAARRQMDEAEYEQEFECSFEAAIQGSYYGRLMSEADREGRITRVPAERNLPVYTAWDLGYTDSTAIWFAQVVGREVRIVDYYEAHSQPLDHYARVLQARPYVYGGHILPHDAEPRQMTSDQSIAGSLVSLGFQNVQVLSNARRLDGINAARNLIPKCWFDAEKCRDGLEALRQYRRDWDEKLNTFKPTPLHDWASHGADAFRYLAVGLPEMARSEEMEEDWDDVDTWRSTPGGY